MKKSNFKTVIFLIIFMTVNGHTYKLFKNIFNDVQTDKGEINTPDITTTKVYFDTISSEGLKVKIYLLIPQLCFTIK